MIGNEVLLAIDNVTTTAEDSAFCVLESLVNFYSKDIDFMDFCSDEMRNEIVMEGSIMDNVKKAGKKDSNKLITFLAFLPRLIAETCKAIARAFNDSSLGKKLKKAGENFEKNASAESKKEMVEKINKEEGKEVVYYDEKSGKIKYKKTMKDGLIALGWLAGTADLIYNLFTNIKKEFDVTNPSNIRTFIDECDKIIRKKSEASKSEVIDMAVGALGDLVDHVGKSAGTIASVGAAASALVSRKLSELEMNGEKAADHNVLVGIKELTNKLSIINASVFAASSVITVVKKFLDYSNKIVVKPKEHAVALNAAAQTALVEKINEIDPSISKSLPRKENESDDTYEMRIIRKYFKNAAKRILPEGASEEEITDNASEAYLQILDQKVEDIKNKSAAEAKAAYDAAVKQYYDEKKKLHEENPVFGKKKKQEQTEAEERSSKIEKIKEKKEKK